MIDLKKAKRFNLRWVYAFREVLMIDRYMKQLSQELHLEYTSEPDEQKMFHLTVTPTCSVSVKELDPGIFLFSKIAPCPQEKREDLFILLMKANLIGQGTGGGAIALDPEENFLTLSLTLPYDMDFKMFKEMLEDFVNFVEYWKEQINKYAELAKSSLE